MAPFKPRYLSLYRSIVSDFILGCRVRHPVTGKQLLWDLVSPYLYLSTLSEETPVRPDTCLVVMVVRLPLSTQEMEREGRDGWLEVLRAASHVFIGLGPLLKVGE